MRGTLKDNTKTDATIDEVKVNVFDVGPHINVPL